MISDLRAARTGIPRSQHRLERRRSPAESSTFTTLQLQLLLRVPVVAGFVLTEAVRGLRTGRGRAESTCKAWGLLYSRSR